MPLDICLLGNTMQHAQYWLTQLEGFNRELTLIKTEYTLILRDGTCFKAHSLKSKHFGKFDQVFLAPGIDSPDAPRIYDILAECMAGSSVPPEFRWHYISQWEEYR